MKVGHLIGITSMTLSATQLLASAGIWIYLLYMAFALNLYMQVAILITLILTAKTSKLLAKSTWEVVKESGLIDEGKDKKGGKE